MSSCVRVSPDDGDDAQLCSPGSDRPSSIDRVCTPVANATLVAYYTDEPAGDDLHGPTQAAVFDAQRRASAGLGLVPCFESLPSYTTALSADELDADDGDLENARKSAEGLANLFPRVDHNPVTDDIVRVSNVDVVDCIVARGLSIHDDDLNPDPLLVVPTRIANRVVSRAPRGTATDVGPRRSVRIAQRQSSIRTPTTTTSAKPTPTKKPARKPGSQRKRPTLHSTTSVPSWSFHRVVHAAPTTRPTSSSITQLIARSPTPPSSPTPQFGASHPSSTLPPSSPPFSSSPPSSPQRASMSSVLPASSPPRASSPPPSSPRAGMPGVLAALSPTPVTPVKRKRKRSLRNAVAKMRKLNATTDSSSLQLPQSVPSIASSLLQAPQTPSSVPTSEFSFLIVPFSADGARPRGRSRTRVQSDNPVSSMPSDSRDPAIPSSTTHLSHRLRHDSAYYEDRRRHYYQSLVLESYTPLAVENVPGRPAVLIEEVNKSKPGWQGSIPRPRIRDVLAVMHGPRFAKMLEVMTLLPYRGLNTMVCDMHGRGVIFRSTPIRNHGDEDLVDLFSSEARDFAELCPISDSDRNANSRGRHWHCIAGVHRQFAKRAYHTKFQVKYGSEISHFFRYNGPASRITRYLTTLLRSRFPDIVARMEANHRWHFNNSKHLDEPLVPQFGLFWNFCVNVPLPKRGVPRVFCIPHADQKNCAVSLCAVFVFWPKELLFEDEWSWLVIWELGIILQCPRGSFVLYPSALFFHFNIRIVKCKKGTRPTQDNSDEIILDNKGGRGSGVWFSQASMYSVTDERDAASGHLPNYEELARACFPEVDSVSVLSPDDCLLDEL